jgi:hypothetical protein
MAKTFWTENLPRFHLHHVMVLIALIAISLRTAGWLQSIVLRAPDWWVTYWREKPARDAWGGPITIHVAGNDKLGTVLGRFQAATAHPRLRYGLRIYIDGGGLDEAGRSLESPTGTEIIISGMPAHKLLRTALEPLGLACKLQDGAVMVTSRMSIDEWIDYGPNHGEVFCEHGERVPLRVKQPGRQVFSGEP